MRRKNIMIFLFLVIVAVTGIWIIQIMNGGMPYVDTFTRDLVAQLGASFLYEPFLFITHLGSRFFLIPFVTIVSIILALWFRHWLPVVFFAGGTLLSHGLNILIKRLVTRERPSILAEANAVGHSFPSGHAMISMVCYGLLGYFITRKLTAKWAILTVQIISSFIVFLIGISRYVINVHYLTDVLVGFFLGYLLLVGFIYLFQFIWNKRSPSKG